MTHYNITTLEMLVDDLTSLVKWPDAVANIIVERGITVDDYVSAIEALRSEAGLAEPALDPSDIDTLRGAVAKCEESEDE